MLSSKMNNDNISNTCIFYFYFIYINSYCWRLMSDIYRVFFTNHSTSTSSDTLQHVSRQIRAEEDLIPDFVCGTLVTKTIAFLFSQLFFFYTRSPTSNRHFHLFYFFFKNFNCRVHILEPECKLITSSNVCSITVHLWPKHLIIFWEPGLLA